MFCQAEEGVREAQGSGGVGGVDERPLQATPVSTSVDTVPNAMTLPRGGPTDGELEVESAVKADGSKTEVKELIDRLLMDNTNTNDAAVAQLTRLSLIYI